LLKIVKLINSKVAIINGDKMGGEEMIKTEKMENEIEIRLIEKINNLLGRIRVEKENYVDKRSIDPDYPSIKKVLCPSGWKLMIELDQGDKGKFTFFYSLVLELEKFFGDLFDSENYELAHMIEAETINSRKEKRIILLTNYRKIFVELRIAETILAALVYKTNNVYLVLETAQIDKKSAVLALKNLAKIAVKRKN